MKDLIKRNFQSILDRKLINLDTTPYDFFVKLEEEYNELKIELDKNDHNRMIEELVDIVLVGINFLHYLGIDPKQELLRKININEQRAKVGE